MCFILCALCMCAYKQMAKVTHSFTIAAILELSQCVNSSQSPLRISKLSFRENQYMYLVNWVEEGLDPKTPLLIQPFWPILWPQNGPFVAISRPGCSEMVDQRGSRSDQGLQALLMGLKWRGKSYSGNSKSFESFYFPALTLGSIKMASYSGLYFSQIFHRYILQTFLANMEEDKCCSLQVLKHSGAPWRTAIE